MHIFSHPDKLTKLASLNVPLFVVPPRNTMIENRMLVIVFNCRLPA